MQLFVDLRKAFHSGIGTYIRNVIPRVLAHLDEHPISVLVSQGELDSHIYLHGINVNLFECPSSPLTFGEQWPLHRQLPRDALFWATSLAHPLFTRNPMVATVHDVAQLALPGRASGGHLVRGASRLYFRSLFSRASLFLFNSEFTQTEFSRYVGTPQAPKVVTPLGVAGEWYDAVAKSHNTHQSPYFLCVGNLRPHKNLRLLLSAFASVLDELPHDLVVIGQHEGFRTADSGLIDVMEKLGPRIRFLGYVNDDELRQWVTGAEAMVFPSLYEGFGLPALEAMAAGCPVLSSSAGALPEVCGEAARYFDPHNHVSLAALLKQQARLEEKELLMVREQGRLRAHQFTWDRTAKLTAHAIQDCISRLHSPKTWAGH